MVKRLSMFWFQYFGCIPNADCGASENELTRYRCNEDILPLFQLMSREIWRVNRVPGWEANSVTKLVLRYTGCPFDILN